MLPCACHGAAAFIHLNGGLPVTPIREELLHVAAGTCFPKLTHGWGVWLQAADAYSAALKCRTSSHILWANRAAALLRLKRPAEALEDARRSRTLQPSFVKARAPCQAPSCHGR